MLARLFANKLNEVRNTCSGMLIKVLLAGCARAIHCAYLNNNINANLKCEQCGIVFVSKNDRFCRPRGVPKKVEKLQRRTVTWSYEGGRDGASENDRLLV